MSMAIDDRTVHLARSVTAIVAPDDLEHFEEDLADYKDDPHGAFDKGGKTLGIGIDAAGVAATAVALYLGDKILDHLIAEGIEQLRKVVRHRGTRPAELPVLSDDVADEVRQVIAAEGRRLKLSESTVQQFSDAFVKAFPRSRK